MKKSKSKRSRIFLIAAILAVAGFGVWYMVAAQGTSKKSTTASTEEKKTQAETDELNKNDPTMDKKTPAASAASTTNQTLSIMVSRPVNNDTLPLNETLEIRSTVSGATSGTCNLTASGPNGKTVTKSTSVKAQSSYGSCSFDIPSSELTAGDWQIAMTVTSGNSTGKTNFKVTLQ